MATYPHQQLELTLRLNDSATKVTRRLRDDLPPHVKGVAEFISQGGIGTGYYLPQHISVNNRLEPVEFINNSWYGLFYNARQKAFFTRESLRIHPDNKFRLGYWEITDAHHPLFKHSHTPEHTASGSGTTDNQPPAEDPTPIQESHESHEDNEFTIAPTFPFETTEDQPPPHQPNNPEEPPNDPFTTNMTNTPPPNGGALGEFLLRSSRETEPVVTHSGTKSDNINFSIDITKPSVTPSIEYSLYSHTSRATESKTGLTDKPKNLKIVLTRHEQIMSGIQTKFFGKNLKQHSKRCGRTGQRCKARMIS